MPLHDPLRPAYRPQQPERSHSTLREVFRWGCRTGIVFFPSPFSLLLPSTSPFSPLPKSPKDKKLTRVYTQWICISTFDHGYAYGPLCGALQPWYGKQHKNGCDFRNGEGEGEGKGDCYDVPPTLAPAVWGGGVGVLILGCTAGGVKSSVEDDC